MPAAFRTTWLAGPSLALVLCCADASEPTGQIECDTGTCLRIATETPAFDPATSTTHYPNGQHTPRTFTDFAWDVEDEEHVSPETYDLTGDFFIQSTNAGFASFFERQFGFVPLYFLRFATGVSVSEVPEEDLRNLEIFNVPIRAPADREFDDRFGFPLDDAFSGSGLVFRTLNQENPSLPRYCVLALEGVEVRALRSGNQRVEAFLRYHCALRPGEREIRLF